jgi:nucleotide-binding universal stress UspA family protein
MNWVVSTIVVPSDGSSAAEVQLASARALARATGARIVVAHINELVRGHMGTHALHPCEDFLEAVVRGQVDDLRDAGVRAELVIRASARDVARAIADLAKQRDADLIVTRQARSGSHLGMIGGGISRRLVRFASCPVLVVSRAG